jgi:hypothetical protein
MFPLFWFHLVVLFSVALHVSHGFGISTPQDKSKAAEESPQTSGLKDRRLFPKIRFLPRQPDVESPIKPTESGTTSKHSLQKFKDHTKDTWRRVMLRRPLEFEDEEELEVSRRRRRLSDDSANDNHVSLRHKHQSSDSEDLKEKLEPAKSRWNLNWPNLKRRPQKRQREEDFHDPFYDGEPIKVGELHPWVKPYVQPHVDRVVTRYQDFKKQIPERVTSHIGTIMQRQNSLFRPDGKLKYWKLPDHFLRSQFK